MIFARKRLPPELAPAFRPFEVALGRVERAKQELMSAVPVARVAPRPLADALFGFDSELLGAREAMAGWRTPELEREWAACSESVAEALRRSQALRHESADLGFESLVGAISDLIEPLRAFERAAERFV